MITAKTLAEVIDKQQKVIDDLTEQLDKVYDHVNDLAEQNKILMKQNQVLMMDDCNKCQYFKDDYKYIIEAMKKGE